MTQEQKAKAYDEALERAKSWAEGKEDLGASARSVCEFIFPELAESEDERIRKAIILGIKRCADAGSIFGTVIYNEGVNYHDVLAYLEKQKEPHYTKRNALFDKCVENCDQKTVEEVNKRVDDIMNMPELSAFEQALSNFIGDWQDDEERWPSQFVKKHGKHILDMAIEELQKEEEIRKPKSLRPGWKPSEEQMRALQNAVALTACDKELARLYNQLKRLKDGTDNEDTPRD